MIARTSSTIRPSRSAIVRLQLSATCMSCVTMTTVDPSRACRSRISARISVAGVGVEIAGRLVGEQNRRIDRQRARDGDALALAAGEFVRADAAAGVRAARASAARSRARRTFARGQPRRCSGSPTFSRHDERRQQIEELEDEPDLVPPDARQPIVGQAAERFAVDAHFAGGRRSRPPIRLSSVDLPEPEGPMIDTISPRGIVSVTSSSAVTWRFPANCLVTRSSSIIRHDYVNYFTKVSNSCIFWRIQARFHVVAAASCVTSGTGIAGRVSRIERHVDRPAFRETGTAGRGVHDLVVQRHARASDPTDVSTAFELDRGRERRRAVVALGVNDHRARARQSGRAAEMTPPRQAALLEVREVRRMIRMAHRIAIAEPHDKLVPEWKAVVGHGR